MVDMSNKTKLQDVSLTILHSTSWQGSKMTWKMKNGCNDLSEAKVAERNEKAKKLYR